MRARPSNRALASMWASVLGLDRVGLDDDFFELGGDSLQAARIAARATAEWKLSIPARTLLEAPTVASMAKTVVARWPAPAGTRMSRRDRAARAP
jgi:acyl carrier protein